MIARALGLGAAAWIGWAWLPHLLTPACVWRGPRGERRVALTFDDGPDPAWTPRVLDQLADLRVSATFCLIGERAERVPDVVRRMAAEGHEVGLLAGGHRLRPAPGAGHLRRLLHSLALVGYGDPSPAGARREEDGA